MLVFFPRLSCDESKRKPEHLLILKKSVFCAPRTVPGGVLPIPFPIPIPSPFPVPFLIPLLTSIPNSNQFQCNCPLPKLKPIRSSPSRSPEPSVITQFNDHQGTCYGLLRLAVSFNLYGLRQARPSDRRSGYF